MKRRQLVRALAIALAVLLVGGTVAGVLMSTLGSAEEAMPRDAHQIEIEYHEDEQALHITQRLVCHNRSEWTLDRMVFNAQANVFRREEALPYEQGELADVFPEGYLPGGIQLVHLTVNGEPANYGWLDSETALRVSCDLAPGQSAEFAFEYWLLLGQNGAFLGQNDTDVRLTGFLFTPGEVAPATGGFVVHRPLAHTRWLLTGPADYRVTVTAPDHFDLAATGSVRLDAQEDGQKRWTVEAENACAFSMSLGMRWRSFERTTDSGVTLRLWTNRRGIAGRLFNDMAQALDVYGDWLGECPVREVDVVQSGLANGWINDPGIILISGDLLDSGDAALALRFCLAQQYIGCAARVETVADAWLSDVPCRYLALRSIELTDGSAAFARALNEQVLDALNFTMPGGLTITDSADLFTHEEYELIVLDRGAAAMHEIALEMGVENWLAGVRRFYEMGREGGLLGEQDFVRAFDEATGGDWETAITHWLFHIQEYVGQGLEWYD